MKIGENKLKFEISEEVIRKFLVILNQFYFLDLDKDLLGYGDLGRFLIRVFCELWKQERSQEIVVLIFCKVKQVQYVNYMFMVLILIFKMILNLIIKQMICDYLGEESIGIKIQYQYIKCDLC